MQKIEIPYFDNTIKDVSGRLIPENILQDSLNIMFDNKKVRARYGLQKFAQSVPGNNGVVKISLYKQLYNDLSYIVAFTKSDIFYLDSGRWKYITRNFCKGTVGNGGVSGTTLTLTPAVSDITIAVGTANANAISYTINLANVTGLEVGMTLKSGTGISTSPPTKIVSITGTTIRISRPTTSIPSGNIVFNHNFDSSWINCEIGFGSTNMDAITTWYPVSSFSATALALVTAQAIANGTVFVVRIKYNGDLDDVWQTAFPYDDSMYGGGDKLLMATNGIDRPQQWKGLQNGVMTFCDNVYEYPNICKHIGFWGTAGSEHIIMSNVYDSNNNWNKTVIEVSDAGEISWEDGATYPLFDSTSPILGVVSLQTRFVIYKRNTISMAEASFSTDVTNPLNIQQDIKRNIGTVSIDTVMDTGSFHLFFTGERIAYFDGYNHGYVDDGIYQYVNRILNKIYAYRSFAFLLQDRNLYCLAIPVIKTDGTFSEYCNMIVVYNYVDKNFTFWRFSSNTGTELNMTAKGQFIISHATTWAEKLVTKATNGSQLTATLATNGTITFNSAVDLSAWLGARIRLSGHTSSEWYIKSITDSTHAVIGTQANKETITTNDITTLTGTVISTAENVTIGFTALQTTFRWSDLKSEDSAISMILGDETGVVYQLGSLIDQDYVTATVPIQSIIETKDYEVNKGLTFLTREITLRIERMLDSLGNYFTGAIYISASVDYGRTWSTAVQLPLDGAVYSFMEKKVALHMRGKALRFRLVAYTPFVLENCFIGYNAQGQSFKYDR